MGQHIPPRRFQHFEDRRGMGLRVGGLEIQGIDNCIVSCLQRDQWLLGAADELLAALQLVRMSAGWQYLSDESKTVIDAALRAATGDPT